MIAVEANTTAIPLAGMVMAITRPGVNSITVPIMTVSVVVGMTAMAILEVNTTATPLAAIRTGMMIITRAEASNIPALMTVAVAAGMTATETLEANTTATPLAAVRAGMIIARVEAISILAPIIVAVGAGTMMMMPATTRPEVVNTTPLTTVEAAAERTNPTSTSTRRKS